MSLISAQGLCKYYAANPVLLDIGFNLARGERVGLIGRNGSGKTTLLRIIAGQEEPDGGTVTLAAGAELGYLSQDLALPDDLTVWQAASAALGPVMAVEQRLRRLEERMASEAVYQDEAQLQRVMRDYERTNAEFERLEGYNAEVRVRSTLTGLGLPENAWTLQLQQLSGGQLTRVALARLLLFQPNLLLLDEPTNHLDLEAITWLESQLVAYPGALLVVSHDRQFLDAVSNRIWELDNHKITVYSGNYSSYLQQREERAQRLDLLAREQARERQQLERLVAKFKAGTRATAAASWQKRLDRMQPVQRLSQQRKMRLRAEVRRRSGNDVLAISDLSKTYPGKPLFRAFSAEVKSRERIALVGPNGSGKTTLLRILLGELPADEGRLRWGASIDLGYFSQDLRLPDEEQTVLDSLLAGTGLLPAAGRSWLARFLFTGESVFQKVASLSGGERNRLILAKLLLSQANVLILDEPTNHLDIPARESLEQALLEYPGTLFIVSHDRYFLQQIVNRIWYFNAGEIRDFRGGYDQFQETLQAERASAVALPAPGDRPRPQVKQNHQAEAARQREARARRLAELEAEIAQLEEERGNLELLLADPNLYKSPDAQETVLRYRQVETELVALYTEWESLVEDEVNP